MQLHDVIAPAPTSKACAGQLRLLRGHHRLVVSAETARRILHKAGITWQRTKTWKRSRDDLDFAAKMARILDLYDHPPVDGRVLCR